MSSDSNSDYNSNLWSGEGKPRRSTKRKSYAEDDDEYDDYKEIRRSARTKRQMVTKPGRKPINVSAGAEPKDKNAKRRIQNRMAQRAFRERKEKYVQDLETRISELEHWEREANRLREENLMLKKLLSEQKKTPTSRYSSVEPEEEEEEVGVMEALPKGNLFTDEGKLGTGSRGDECDDDSDTSQLDYEEFVPKPLELDPLQFTPDSFTSAMDSDYAQTPSPNFLMHDLDFFPDNLEKSDNTLRYFPDMSQSVDLPDEAIKSLLAKPEWKSMFENPSMTPVTLASTGKTGSFLPALGIDEPRGILPKEVLMY
ncbi:uncharacterized protein VTP21DRAFT_3021 [Calcarisporiella thermophila]|uniref:uncharacterized protein n=1 Tax=Calcarisporiella thermophila TaxID=911321 RepID=UPI0037425ED8